MGEVSAGWGLGSRRGEHKESWLSHLKGCGAGGRGREKERDGWGWVRVAGEGFNLLSAASFLHNPACPAGSVGCVYSSLMDNGQGSCLAPGHVSYLSPASPWVSSSLYLTCPINVSLSTLPDPPQQGYNLGHLSLMTIKTRAGFKFKVQSTPNKNRALTR